MMDQNRSAELEAFERILDIYGGDEARWPAEARRRFRTLPRRDARARALLAEARALERLLDEAPLPSPERVEALRERIVDAAQRIGVEHRAAFPRASLLDRPRRAFERARGMLRLPPHGAGSSFARPQAGWRVAAVLAASLVAGVFIGRAQPVSSAIQAMAERTVESGDSDQYAVALFDDAGFWPGSVDGEDEL
jgi:hypothetical protein